MTEQINTYETVALRLLEREFLVSCAPDERDSLVAAGKHLDHDLRELRARSKTAGFDRLLVLTAINMTHELLSLREDCEHDAQNLSRHIALLRHKLETVLDAKTKLD